MGVFYLSWVTQGFSRASDETQEKSAPSFFSCYSDGGKLEKEKKMSQIAITWFTAHADWFEKSKSMEIMNKLQKLPDEQTVMLMQLNYKNPTTIWVLAFFIGHLGIHCFMLRDIVGGIIRLLTFDLLGVFWIMDLFTTKSRVQNYNAKLIQPYL